MFDRLFGWIGLRRISLAPHWSPERYAEISRRIDAAATEGDRLAYELDKIGRCKDPLACLVKNVKTSSRNR